MIEAQFDANKIYELDKLNEHFHKPGFEIVKSKATFLNKTKGAAELYGNAQQLEDLKPREVFLELIGQQDYDEAMKNDILSAFDELLEEVHSNEPSVKI